MGHPSGVEFVFMWRIGRLEVGALYPEENGGTTFALDAIDGALRAQCQQLAAVLDAELEHTACEGGDGADGDP
jgi:hypothetical protein